MIDQYAVNEKDPASMSTLEYVRVIRTLRLAVQTAKNETEWTAGQRDGVTVELEKVRRRAITLKTEKAALLNMQGKSRSEIKGLKAEAERHAEAAAEEYANRKTLEMEVDALGKELAGTLVRENESHLSWTGEKRNRREVTAQLIESDAALHDAHIVLARIAEIVNPLVVDDETSNDLV